MFNICVLWDFTLVAQLVTKHPIKLRNQGFCSFIEWENYCLSPSGRTLPCLLAARRICQCFWMTAWYLAVWEMWSRWSLPPEVSLGTQRSSSGTWGLIQSLLWSVERLPLISLGSRSIPGEKMTQRQCPRSLSFVCYSFPLMSHHDSSTQRNWMAQESENGPFTSRAWIQNVKCDWTWIQLPC